MHASPQSSTLWVTSFALRTPVRRAGRRAAAARGTSVRGQSVAQVGHHRHVASWKRRLGVDLIEKVLGSAAGSVASRRSGTPICSEQVRDVVLSDRAGCRAYRRLARRASVSRLPFPRALHLAQSLHRHGGQHPTGVRVERQRRQHRCRGCGARPGPSRRCLVPQRLVVGLEPQRAVAWWAGASPSTRDGEVGLLGAAGPGEAETRGAARRPTRSRRPRKAGSAPHRSTTERHSPLLAGVESGEDFGAAATMGPR